jgi:hypothetical protein
MVVAGQLYREVAREPIRALNDDRKDAISGKSRDAL